MLRRKRAVAPRIRARIWQPTVPELRDRLVPTAGEPRPELHDAELLRFGDRRLRGGGAVRGHHGPDGSGAAAGPGDGRADRGVRADPGFGRSVRVPLVRSRHTQPDHAPDVDAGSARPDLHGPAEVLE